MPPKLKVTRDGIINTALMLCRMGGESAINARGIAKALNCSTQPIFSNFESMEEIDEAVRDSAYELYLEFLENEARTMKYPRYKAFGMAYIRFAKEEKELFKLLFMCDRNEKTATRTSDFQESVQMIMKNNGIEKEAAERIHLETWVFTHGIATMLATSFLELDQSLISDMLTDVYQSITAKYKSEDK